MSLTLLMSSCVLLVMSVASHWLRMEAIARVSSPAGSAARPSDRPGDEPVGADQRRAGGLDVVGGGGGRLQIDGQAVGLYRHREASAAATQSWPSGPAGSTKPPL